jgi:hypothetical protein
MPKGTTTALDTLKKFLQAVALPWDAIGNVYISLHTANPGPGGDQTTNEATYTSYDRVEVVRTAAGWTTANPSANALDITFPQCGGGTNVITHVAIGTVDFPGAGQLLYTGALANPITISNLITPRILAGQLTVTEI